MFFPKTLEVRPLVVYSVILLVFTDPLVIYHQLCCVSYLVDGICDVDIGECVCARTCELAVVQSV